MRIAMIGTGYVGLVSGACFADFGHHVTCVDKDAGKIAALHRGEMPIFEPGLDALVAANVKARRLDFATDLKAPVAEADAVFIAVGTPSRRGDGHADLSYVYAAAREIAAALDGFTVVVTKSTVPVGTGDEVERFIREANPTPMSWSRPIRNSCARARRSATSSFPTASWSAPSDERARKVLGEIYRPLSLNQAPIMFTGAAHRGADQIRRQRLPRHQDHLHQRDRRSLPKRSAPTCRKSRAASGSTTASAPSSCTPGRASAARAFPRTRARWSRPRRTTTCSCASSRRCSASTTTASARWRARSSNAAGGNLRGKTVAVLGLTFKPDTDDMREAPSIPLVTGLLDMGAKVRAHDPVGMEQARKELPEIEYCDDPYECVQGRRRAGDRHRMGAVPRARPRTAEGARWRSRSWSICATSIGPRKWRAHGFVYESVGRRPNRRCDASYCHAPRKRGSSQ